MPRKKQIVQKQKRRKVYGGGEMSAAASQIKPRGAFRIFTNYKLFAIVGAVVLMGGFLIGAFFQNNRGSSSKTGVRGAGVIKATPEAGSTSTTGAAPTVKQYTAPPLMTIDAGKTYTATIKTERGDITVELDAKAAPTTVNNFVYLAKDGFYNGVTFYRVIADSSGKLHYAQSGDPTGTGSGGPGYDLPAEKTSIPFTAGTLAMARPSEANAPNNGSQFYFTLTDEPAREGRDTAFGKVIDGLNVLEQLTPRDPQQQQNLEPGARIESITIQES